MVIPPLVTLGWWVFRLAAVMFPLFLPQLFLIRKVSADVF